MHLREIDKYEAAAFVAPRHYSAVMPRHTSHYMGCYQDDSLVGVITFGWGTRPLHTIRHLFPELTSKDYFEIGKMCMDASMPRNSESQMLSLGIKWLREHTDKKFLFTWADGIVGKPGYVYQAANFLYGGFIWTDTYLTEKGEKVHPRTLQGQNRSGETKYGSRPDFDQRVALGLSRVKGKQFRFIYPLTRPARKLLKSSTVVWGLNYPKHADLEWRVKRPGQDQYELTKEIPFTLSKEAEFNQRNIAAYQPKEQLPLVFLPRD